MKKLCIGIFVILIVLVFSVPSFAQYNDEIRPIQRCNFCSWGFTAKHQNLDADISHSNGVTKTHVAASQKMFTATHTGTWLLTRTPKYWGFGRYWLRFPIDVKFGKDCEFVANFQHQEWSGNGITIKQTQWAIAKAQSHGYSYSSSIAQSLSHRHGYSRSCSYSSPRNHNPN